MLYTEEISRETLEKINNLGGFHIEKLSNGFHKLVSDDKKFTHYLSMKEIRMIKVDLFWIFITERKQLYISKKHPIDQEMIGIFVHHFKESTEKAAISKILKESELVLVRELSGSYIILDWIL